MHGYKWPINSALTGISVGDTVESVEGQQTANSARVRATLSAAAAAAPGSQQQDDITLELKDGWLPLSSLTELPTPAIADWPAPAVHTYHP